MKKPWLSKTLWTNLLLALVAFIPTVGEFVGKNPQVVLFFFGAVNMVLRLVTKDKVSLE